MRNIGKKLILFLATVTLVATGAFAGGEMYSSKEAKQTTTPQPFCDWYANQEWNASVWGTYAFTGNDWPDDRYLAVDHAWGGGGDFKFFFARYFGIGAEGFGLNARDTVGAALGTLTLRYPVPSTRFAPYVYIGGGALFNGSEIENHGEEDDSGFFRTLHSADAKAVGQFGGGLEIRLTPHIGLFHDFNWNVVDGHDNNFGMVRTGINFAF
jgi:hypothetical protein